MSKVCICSINITCFYFKVMFTYSHVSFYNAFSFFFSRMSYQWVQCKVVLYLDWASIKLFVLSSPIIVFSGANISTVKYQLGDLWTSSTVCSLQYIKILHYILLTVGDYHLPLLGSTLGMCLHYLHLGILPVAWVLLGPSCFVLVLFT